MICKVTLKAAPIRRLSHNFNSLYLKYEFSAGLLSVTAGTREGSVMLCIHDRNSQRKTPVFAVRHNFHRSVAIAVRVGIPAQRTVTGIVLWRVYCCAL
eukprot:17667-Heterococcus_DN1.PRE.7